MIGARRGRDISKNRQSELLVIFIWTILREKYCACNPSTLQNETISVFSLIIDHFVMNPDNTISNYLIYDFVELLVKL